MNIKQLVLCATLSLFCGTATWAVSEEELVRLESDMLKYFPTTERDTFFSITDQLKDASKSVGNDRLFYKAWGNQAIYEATQQNYQKAMEIVQAIEDNAQEYHSTYGAYYALHTRAVVLLQKQDYQAAEREFLQAVDFSHRHFPNESAGDDLQELMRIANHRKDAKASVGYARQILVEPNVAPIHKGRALFRLSQMAFNKQDTAEFNRIYAEMMLLKETDGIATLTPVMEVNHCIINGDFGEALRLSDELDPEARAERKAVIYHSMGDDANAYKYMQIYKKVSDSIILVSHGNVVNSCYVQMNNDRLQLEQKVLEEQNNKLRNRFYLAIAVLAFIVLLIFTLRGRKIIKRLTMYNKKLANERKEAERALEELSGLASFEKATELPLDMPAKVNRLCDHITTSAQAHCHKGVTAIFLSDVPDDFEVRTNSEALEQLLTHLVNYFIRFTQKGAIVLSVTQVDEKVRFTVANSRAGLDRDTELPSEDDSSERHADMSFNICQSIAHLLHGRMWHDTEYTNGTRFCIEIPQFS